MDPATRRTRRRERQRRADIAERHKSVSERALGQAGLLAAPIVVAILYGGPATIAGGALVSLLLAGAFLVVAARPLASVDGSQPDSEELEPSSDPGVIDEAIIRDAHRGDPPRRA